jgi:AcrR family transcriptional regulator
MVSVSTDPTLSGGASIVNDVPTGTVAEVDRDAKAELLAAVIAHLADHGLAGATLRSIAAAIGTSHRMLIYHFGSRDVRRGAAARTSGG